MSCDHQTCATSRKRPECAEDISQDGSTTTLTARVNSLFTAVARATTTGSAVKKTVNRDASLQPLQVIHICLTVFLHVHDFFLHMAKYCFVCIFFTILLG